MTDLLAQISEWSFRNFGDKQASDLGIVEEIGEACHGLLKRMQGIRGFDDDAKYKAHMADCFADMGVYMLNYAGVNGLLLHGFAEYDLPLGFNDRRCVSQLLMGVSLIVEFADSHGPIILDDNEEKINHQCLQGLLQKVWDWTGMWARYHGFDFRTIVTETWFKVRQRDWSKNKTHAHLVAEEGGTETPTPPVVATNGDVGSATPEPGAISATDLEARAPGPMTPAVF